MGDPRRPMTVPRILRTLRSWRRVGRWWPGDGPFEVAVGAILTQQASWTSVERSLAGLRAEGLMSPGAILDADEAALARAIRPSGFPARKSRTLRGLCAAMSGGWDAAPPRERLLAVTGIGEETADDILLYGYGEARFVVDAYALRLFSRLPLPHGGPDSLRASVPREVAGADALMELHGLIVELCKEHCRKTPACAGCPFEGACERRGVGAGRASSQPGRPSRRSSRTRR